MAEKGSVGPATLWNSAPLPSDPVHAPSQNAVSQSPSSLRQIWSPAAMRPNSASMTPGPRRTRGPCRARGAQLEVLGIVGALHTHWARGLLAQRAAALRLLARPALVRRGRALALGGLVCALSSSESAAGSEKRGGCLRRGPGRASCSLPYTPPSFAGGVVVRASPLPPRSACEPRFIFI